MKKFILLLVACVSFAIASAQTAVPVTLPADQWFVSYVGNATLDTVTVGNTWYKEILPNKGQRLMYNIRVKITEVSAVSAGTPVAVALQGKVFDTDTYTTITTLNYRGTGSDTTLTYSEASTPQVYRYFKVLITPASGKVKTTFIKASFKQ
jgi:hypothetical protein